VWTSESRWLQDGSKTAKRPGQRRNDRIVKDLTLLGVKNGEQLVNDKIEMQLVVAGNGPK